MSLASMEKHLFNLKFAAKELERSSKKCDKEEKAEKLKQSLPPGLQVITFWNLLLAFVYF